MLSPSPMACNNTASLEKLTCTIYVDFGKNKDKFGQLSWSKKYSNYLDNKPKVLKRDNNRDLRLVQNLTMGVTDFNQFMRLKKQLVILAENFGREQKLPPVLTQTLSTDIDEQLKMVHKVIKD